MEYRRLLRDRRTRRLLAGLGISSLGDGMSTVTIAWLALRIAPVGDTGGYVGLAIAAYTLPGVIGALAFGRLLRDRPARALVLGHCLLRAGCLGAVALLGAAGELGPVAYVALLAGSSMLTAWGNAGQYTMLGVRRPRPGCRCAAAGRVLDGVRGRCARRHAGRGAAPRPRHAPDHAGHRGRLGCLPGAVLWSRQPAAAVASSARK